MKEKEETDRGDAVSRSSKAGDHEDNKAIQEKSVGNNGIAHGAVEDDIEESSYSSGSSSAGGSITLNFKNPFLSQDEEPSQLTVPPEGFTGPEDQPTQQSLPLLPPWPNVTPNDPTPPAPQARTWDDSNRNIFPIVEGNTNQRMLKDRPGIPECSALTSTRRSTVPVATPRSTSNKMDLSIGKPAPGAEYLALYERNGQFPPSNPDNVDTDHDDDDATFIGDDNDAANQGESRGVDAGTDQPDFEIAEEGPNDWMKDDALYHLFNTRWRENGTAKTKRLLFMKCLHKSSLQGLFPRSFIRSHPDFADEMNQLEGYLRNTMMHREKKWKVPFLATAMRNLAKWIEKCDASGHTKRKGEPEALKAVRKYLQPCYNRLKSDASHNEMNSLCPAGTIRPTQRVARGLSKVGLQPQRCIKNGTTIQNEMLEKLGQDWVKSIVGKFPCPYCDHNFVIYERDPADVSKETAELMFDYDTKLAQWMSQHGGNKGRKGGDDNIPKKPEKPTIPEVMYVCMFGQSMCRPRHW